MRNFSVDMDSFFHSFGFSENSRVGLIEPNKRIEEP